MSQHVLQILSILLFAAAALLVGSVLLRQLWQFMRSEKMLEEMIDVQEHPGQEKLPQGPLLRRWLDGFLAYMAHWVDTPLGKQLVAQEDRTLLDQCGVNDSRGKTLFFATRVLLGIGLPILAWIIFSDKSRTIWLIAGFMGFALGYMGFALGYMGPKWVMQIRAKERRQKAAEELPLLIDLLRLLQGVGMSIDQSLHVVENEFSRSLPILSKELQMAAQQYMNGRTREQSLRRFSTVFENEDMSAVARLIAQVDRYGGAVQQPLQQFSDRLREQRKLDMKEKVGKLTVKMTGVMVLALLPALLIITGGAGFLAIVRVLSKMGGAT
ncbi:secretion system protein [Herminiimonas sp. KBW02]|uniref:type II secretion system F family protein n=1 Tax=Herminiimonas sp. KBW02 TaxID=2153363 RepID=UPI000F5B456A|nr:type II secretion system F family protein [Herminiimonas sp. KBW02]RQO34665.1 secretion system protein [Herminiimonas sp. KBW02]